jgi:ribosomal protein S18 acetylase RimI-like enzyme
VNPKSGVVAYRLRAATPEDGEFIYQLRVDGLKEYVTQVWGWDEEFNRELFRQKFNSRSYQMIVVNDRDIGAVALEHRENETFLADIEIAREWRGLGLGTAIIREFLANARRQGVPAALQVLKVNPARHLYQRLGFQVVGETDTHYLMRTVRPDSGSSKALLR